MADGGGLLDVGTLTGTIEMDDRLTGVLESVIHRVENFAESFTHRFGAITIGVGAVATAITGIAATITTLAVKGSEIADVETGFDRLAGSAENADKVLEGMRKGVAGTVTDLQLMQDANRLLQAGVKANAGDFETLTSAARTLSREGFGPMEGLMSQIDRAMMTGNATRLSRIGITVDTKKAENDFAGALGISAKELSHNQELEARRMAIVAAANKLVGEAGVQELSFAEKVRATRVSLANWSEELEKRIATSPAVARAFDAIGDAIKKAFGGDSAVIQDKIVGWVNKFADAAAYYGPIIIDWMGKIKDYIVDIYGEVIKAWDSVPDWFKNIAKDAGLASLAVYGVSKGFQAVTSSWADNLSVGNNILQIFGTNIPSALKTAFNATDEFVEMYKTFGDELGFWKVAQEWSGLASLRTSVNKAGEAVIAATGSWSTFALQLGTGAVIVASAAAVGTALYQAYKLYSEHRERVAAQERQAVVDTSNLAIINKALGTSFKDINEATQAYLDNAKKHPPIVKAMTEAEKAAADALEEHSKKVDAVKASLQALAHQTDLTGEAFDKLTGAEQVSIGVRAKMLSFYDEQIRLGKELTASELERYKSSVLSQENFRREGEEKLAQNKITLEYINHQKALGATEQQIASLLGVTSDALSVYTDKLAKSTELARSIQEDTLAYATKLHHNSVNDWMREEDLKFQHTMAKLRETGKATEQELDFEVQKHEEAVRLEIQSREEGVEGSKASFQKKRDEAKSLLDLMEADTEGFTQSQIQHQREVYRQNESDLGHWRQVAEENFKKGADAADGVSKSVDGIGDSAGSSGEKIRMLNGELVSLDEAIRRRNQGGSQEVTSQNFEESLQKIITSGGYDPTGSASNIDKNEAYRLAAQGYGFQEIIDIFNKRKSGGGGAIPPPHGPAIPGFAGAEGGGGSRGGHSGTAEPSTHHATLPTGAASDRPGTAGKGAGAGISMTNTFHVNGTAEESARKIGAILFGNAQLGKQFG